MAKPTESPSYHRLTDSERQAILIQHDKGETQTAIAQRLGRSVSTINDVIQAFTPTDRLAKRKLVANALRMAENVIENGKPRDHVAALKGLNVLDESASGPTVVIQIGAEHGDVSVHAAARVTLSPPNQGLLGESTQNP